MICLSRAAGLQGQIKLDLLSWIDELGFKGGELRLELSSVSGVRIQINDVNSLLCGNLAQEVDSGMGKDLDFFTVSPVPVLVKESEGILEEDSAAGDMNYF